MCEDSLSYSSVVVLVIRTKKRNAINPKPMQNSSEKTQEWTFLLVTSGVFIYELIFINLNQFYFGIIEIQLQFSLIF